MSNLQSFLMVEREISGCWNWPRTWGASPRTQPTLVAQPDDRLQGLTKYKVQSLTRRRYLETFEVLQSVSNEYADMAKFVSKQIKNRFSNRFSLLDIGAGSGHMLKALANQMSLDDISDYVAVEPDAVAAADLIRTLDGYAQMKSFVEVERFDEALATELGRKFDVILFSHSLYGMDDPIRALREARKLLSDRGVIIVILNTPIGLVKYYVSLSTYLERDIPSLEDFAFDSQKLAMGLRQARCDFEMLSLPSSFDVTALYNGSSDGDHRRLEFMSFATQCELAKAPDSLRHDAELMLRSSCVNQGERVLLPQSMAGFVLN